MKPVSFCVVSCSLLLVLLLFCSPAMSQDSAAGDNSNDDDSKDGSSGPLQGEDSIAGAVDDSKYIAKMASLKMITQCLLQPWRCPAKNLGEQNGEVINYLILLRRVGFTVQFPGADWNCTTKNPTLLRSSDNCNYPTVSSYIKNFERDQPIELKTVQVNQTTLSITWTLPNFENVTDLVNFELYHHKRKFKYLSDFHEAVTIPPNETTYSLGGLELGTYYSFYVLANYSTGHLPVSHTFSYRTLGAGPDRPCDCNATGTNLTGIARGEYECDRLTERCPCKPDVIGSKCDGCAKNYFWHPKLACQPCACSNNDRSRETCVARKGQIWCDCLPTFGGPRCTQCANGYFSPPDGSYCEPCDCNANELAGSPHICDRNTGVCQDCAFNTTGEHCEDCLEGFVGDAIYGKNCTLYEDVYNRLPPIEHQNTLILAICVTVFVLLLACILLLTWQRCCRRKPQLQFWTVELRDDHEQVSFAALADQPDYVSNNAQLQFAGMPYTDRDPHARDKYEETSPDLHRKSNIYRKLDDRHIEA